MKFFIDNAVLRRFPSLKIGVVVIRNLKNNADISEIIYANQVKDMDKSNLSSHPEIKMWREAYSWMGAKPKKYKCSVEALLRRVLNGEQLPSINPLVDFYNVMSLKFILPMGGDDLNGVKGNIQLTVAKGDESFVPIGSDGIENPKEGEVVYKDDDGVLCRRWNWRECDRTKLRDETEDAILYVESLAGGVSDALMNIVTVLKDVFGIESKSFVLNKDFNGFDIENLELIKNTEEISEVVEQIELGSKGKKDVSENKNRNADSSRAQKMQFYHWADSTADKIFKQKGEKEKYVVASGITPSGVVHIGNFREIITVDLVARAIKDAGKNVRFIYSWDDYDVFRKVPKGWPKQEELVKELRKPIVDVFDPFDKEDSFARHNEVAVEKQLPRLGIKPEYIYQSQQYRDCQYTNGMKIALENSAKIKEELDKYRKEPLPADWIPISVFDPETGVDEVSELKYLGGTEVRYKNNKGKLQVFDFSKDGRGKLLWRTDWPMRWAYEKVDFEPGGKDHSSPGGSYSTGKELVKLFGWEAPLYIMYDFISIKGMGGKISSSTGNVITLVEVLDIYEPEIVRWIFAGTRPNTEFSISFDIDVIKIYEDFDKCERIYFKTEDTNEKNYLKQKRIYELSMIDSGKIFKKLPVQIGFRHLTTVLQIFEMDIEKTLDFLDEVKTESDRERVRVRAVCAKNWLEKYAPDEFKFSVKDEIEKDFVIDGKIKKVFSEISEIIGDNLSDKELHEKFYEIAKANYVEPAEFFKSAYMVLIGKEKGPQLANFMLTIGKKRVKKLFSMI